MIAGGVVSWPMGRPRAIPTAEPMAMIAPPVADGGWGRPTFSVGTHGAAEYVRVRLSWPSGRRYGGAVIRATIQINLLFGRPEMVLFRPAGPWRERGLGGPEALASMDGLLAAMSRCPGCYPLSPLGHRSLWTQMLSMPMAQASRPPWSETLPPADERFPRSVEPVPDPRGIRSAPVDSETGQWLCAPLVERGWFRSGGPRIDTGGASTLGLTWIDPDGADSADLVGRIQIADIGLEPVMRQIVSALFGVGADGRPPDCWARASRALAVQRMLVDALGQCPDCYPLTTSGNAALLDARTDEPRWRRTACPPRG